MAQTSDGFEIARQDLQIRGPGELLGARQSGSPLLRFADLEADAHLLEWARHWAPVLLREHPQLAAQHLERWLGGKAEYKEGSLIIYGGCECKEAVLSSYNDHRMAMSAAIAAINHNKRIILDGSESVSKSYPDFFTDYKKLGGKADDIHS